MQVIMAFAKTDCEGTLLNPIISVHGSISEAEAHFLQVHVPKINDELGENEEIIDRLDDSRIEVKVEADGTTTIAVDPEGSQAIATMKVIL